MILEWTSDGNYHFNLIPIMLWSTVPLILLLVLNLSKKHHAYFKRWSYYFDAIICDNDRDSNNNGSNDRWAVDVYLHFNESLLILIKIYITYLEFDNYEYDDGDAFY